MDMRDAAAPAPGDAELISRSRRADSEAFMRLRARHADGAARLAEQLVGAGDAATVVFDAVARARVELTGGGGPDLAFRPYVLALIRDAAEHRATVSTPSDAGIPYTGKQITGPRAIGDDATGAGEETLAARAYLRMPERWRAALWHAEVEGDPPDVLAELLGVPVAAANNIVQRARDGVRRIHLQADLDSTLPDVCCAQRDRMADAARGRLSEQRRDALSTHLARCARCHTVRNRLVDAEANLGELIGAAVLGPAAARYARPPVRDVTTTIPGRRRIRRVPVTILAAVAVLVVAGWSVAFAQMADSSPGGSGDGTGTAPSSAAPAAGDRAARTTGASPPRTGRPTRLTRPRRTASPRPSASVSIRPVARSPRPTPTRSADVRPASTPRVGGTLRPVRSPGTPSSRASASPPIPQPASPAVTTYRPVPRPTPECSRFLPHCWIR